MRCDLQSVLAVLPPRLQRDMACVDTKRLQELRLRAGLPPELVFGRIRRNFSETITGDDLNYVVNAASRYSPWAAETISQGFITIRGGHRIGLCGEVVIKNGIPTAMRRIDSLCIRIARDHNGLIKQIPSANESVLILGAPGWGKTTLLRDLIRSVSMESTVAVVDERGEVFPDGFDRGKHTDVLTGCPKAEGISRVLRTMGPGTIAVDEVTLESDCRALDQAANCGVRLMATVHAVSLYDLRSREVYRKLIENQLFHTLYVLRSDNTYREERIT